MLGSALGALMTPEAMEKSFRAMDRAGTGRVTLDHFEVWWKEQEAESRIGDMDEGDVAEVSWHDQRAHLLSWHNHRPPAELAQSSPAC